jgi:hypothetical protein
MPVVELTKGARTTRKAALTIAQHRADKTQRDLRAILTLSMV